MTTTTQVLLYICPDCSTSEETPAAPVAAHLLREQGFEFHDGAWYGRCEDCRDKHTEAANAEYEALARAAAQLGRIHNAGPLAEIQVPPAEGFHHEGERHFGFWAISGDLTDAGFDRFRRSAAFIVAELNSARGTGLVVNINTSGTQAIVHGLRS